MLPGYQRKRGTTKEGISRKLSITKKGKMTERTAMRMNPIFSPFSKSNLLKSTEKHYHQKEKHASINEKPSQFKNRDKI